MAEIIRWSVWELNIRQTVRSEMLYWTISSPSQPGKAEFFCPKSAIPEIIAALTKLALEGEE